MILISENNFYYVFVDDEGWYIIIVKDMYNTVTGYEDLIGKFFWKGLSLSVQRNSAIAEQITNVLKEKGKL